MATSDAAAPTVVVGSQEDHESSDAMAVVSAGRETITARQELMRELSALLRPHTKIKHQKPPFSADEMVIMMLVLHGEETRRLSQLETLQKILCSFTYYTERAAMQFADVSLENRLSSIAGNPDLCVAKDVQDTFRKTSVPLTSELPKQSVSTESLYFVKTAEARLFLRERLAPPRKGTFRFLELSAELRNAIYEYILSRPAQDCVDMSLLHDGRVQWQLHQRDNGCTAGSSRLTYHRKSGESFDPPTIQATLAILSTCRQIYHEARPLFYALNMHHFTTAEGFSTLFTTVSASRITCLSKVSITLELPWQPGNEIIDFDRFPAAVNRLGSLPTLRELKVEVNCDRNWLWMELRHLQALGRKRPFWSYTHIPGMTKLASVAARVERFAIEGNCPKFRDFMDKAIESIKLKGKGKAKTKSKAKTQTDMAGQQVVTRGGGRKPKV